MFDSTRREWLIQVSRSLSLAGAAFAVQLPPGFTTPATPACDPSTKPTPARWLHGIQGGPPGRQLTLEGAVIGIRCGLVAGAVVLAATDDARATATTDAGGRYRISLVLPKVVAAPSVGITLDVPKKAKLMTYLFLPDPIAHAENAKAAGFDPLLRMKLVQQTPEVIHASFDVILDL